MRTSNHRPAAQRLLLMMLLLLLPSSGVFCQSPNASGAGDVSLPFSRLLFLPKELQDFADTDLFLPVTRNSVVPPLSFLQASNKELNLSEGQRLLLIGRATGYAAAFFAEQGAQVFVAEQDPSLIEEYRQIWESVGKERIIPITYPEYLLENRDAAFDAVFIHANVERIPSLITARIAERGLIMAPFTANREAQIMLIMQKEGEAWNLRSNDLAFFPGGTLNLE